LVFVWKALGVLDAMTVALLPTLCAAKLWLAAKQI
jgi:hypothetical protein